MLPMLWKMLIICYLSLSPTGSPREPYCSTAHIVLEKNPRYKTIKAHGIEAPEAARYPPLMFNKQRDYTQLPGGFLFI